MNQWHDVLSRRLQQQREQQLERHLTAFKTLDARHLKKLDSDLRLVNFCSNDYLGLRHHPEILSALANKNHTAGAGAARLLGGNHPIHEQLEQQLASFFQRDDALLFSSGYVANLTILQALSHRGDVIIQDRLCHASLVDGGRLADGKLLRYQHNDLQHCQTLLEQSASQTGFQMVATDGVFSMDGDLAPVSELAQLAAKHQALLMIDDAHGIGVLGQHGRGLLEQAGLSAKDVPLLLGAFGKAFGLAGAFITGDQLLIDYLRNFARGWIYSTAPPIPLVQAQCVALQLIQNEPERRQRLHQNIKYFRQLASQLSIPLLPSETPIQPLLLGCVTKTLQIQAELESQGFYVAAIRPPTVPTGTSRLRITLSSEHQKQDIEKLLTVLAASINTQDNVD